MLDRFGQPRSRNFWLGQWSPFFRLCKLRALCPWTLLRNHCRPKVQNQHCIQLCTQLGECKCLPPLPLLVLTLVLLPLLLLCVHLLRVVLPSWYPLASRLPPSPLSFPFLLAWSGESSCSSAYFLRKPSCARFLVPLPAILTSWVCSGPHHDRQGSHLFRPSRLWSSVHVAWASRTH